MTNQELRSAIMDTVAAYNRRMYQYGKSYRNYGTSQMLRADQIQLISLIGGHPNINLRTLAELTHTSPPTLSFQVNRLVGLHLLEKRRSPSNQREIIITLTEEGRQAHEYHKNLDNEYFTTAIEGLKHYTSEELEAIYDFMKRLDKNDFTLSSHPVKNRKPELHS